MPNLQVSGMASTVDDNERPDFDDFLIKLWDSITHRKNQYKRNLIGLNVIIG